LPLALQPALAGASEADAATGLTHEAESIHQEVVFAASRARVYAALVDAAQFAEVMKLGAARKLVAAPDAIPAAIEARVGGAFTLFGGYITGVQIELARDERIVQAWHEKVWADGEFSIARFELYEAGTGTRLVFDHRGFPQGAGPHLAVGWYGNYWEPLKAFLARPA
jgi:activator of HSP90 ATPase